MRLDKFHQLLGIDVAPVTHREKLISAAGGFLGILGVYLVSGYSAGLEGSLLIVPSMGASAVLLFAVPHGALSQPWNLIGGHLISAVIGVACAQLIEIDAIAAAASVGLAIGAMYSFRCIHPPGGATALAAVIGGSQIQALGFLYVLLPVLANVAVILFVTVLFNPSFNWRRYPVSLSSPTIMENSEADGYAPIEHADLVYALSEIESFIDVTEEDLLRIYSLATGRYSVHLKDKMS